MKLFRILILLLSISVYSQSGKVIKVKDGDTVVILDSLNNQITLRVAEIDCPEKGQPFGAQAKNFTAEKIGLKKITYQVISKDQYNRLIAKIYYDGKYLSNEIIKNGFGWHYKQYSNSKELSDLEIKSKNSKIGLWKEKNPTPPWEYRKNKKLPMYYGF